MIGNEYILKASRCTWILLVLLALSIIEADPAHAALACNVCHSMPPSDSAVGDRQPATGAFKGNHQGHSGNSISSCIPCHGTDVSSYSPAHRGTGVKSVIKLTPALNNYSIGHTLATYSRGTFFNQTTVPPTPLGICSNVNCHFENDTPAWGTTNFVVPTDCDKCHGAPPSGTTTGAAGSHAKHFLRYTGVTNCRRCHPNNANFQHATSAGNRPLGVNFAAAPNNGNGSYTGPLKDYLPSQTNLFGDCSATYCHGTTMSVAGDKNGGTNITPTWGTASTGQCGTCHGVTSTNPPLRGSHQTHAGNSEYTHAPGGLNDKIYGRGIACTTCHKTGTNKHVDGNADWSFDSTSNSLLSGSKYRALSSGSISPVPSTYGQCSNLYCHSIVQTSTGGPLTGLVNEYKTPTWGNMDEGTCGSCHAVDLGHATWAGRAGAPEISSGSHTKHLQIIGLTAGIGGTPGGPARCAICHNYGSSDSLLSCATVCHNAQSAHVDYKVDVKYPPALYGVSAGYNGTPVPGDGFGGCSSTYCHSNGKSNVVFSSNPSPNWGSGTMSCSGCHGGAKSSFNAISSGSHAKHISVYSYGCMKCHGVTASSNTSINDQSRHVNRAVEVAFNNTTTAFNGKYNTVAATMASPSSKLPGSAYASCEGTYCHSPGNKATNYDPPKQSATWGGTLGCAGCHDATPLTGSHNAHVATTYGVAVACYKCHAATVTTGMTILSATNHANRLVDIAFDSTTTAVFGKYSSHLTPMQKKPGSGYANCENVYCHSNGQGANGTGPLTYSAPKWFDSPSGKCGTCHNSGFHAGAPITSGSHTKHIFNDFAGSQNQNICGVCHYGAGFTDTACAQCHFGGGKLTTLHVNHNVDVSFITKFGGTYNGTPVPGDVYGSCASNYCHSDGKATPTTYTNPAWGNAASGACGTCHGATAAAPPASTPHAKHVGSAYPYIISCASCHSGKVQVTANSTIQPAYTNLTSHVDKLRDVKFNSVSPFGTYSTVNQSCRNLYCHSIGNLNVTAGALPPAYNGAKYIRQTWSGTLSCNGCHGRSTEAGEPDYTNGGPGATTANSHSKHLSFGDISCSECHRRTTVDGTTIRADVSPSSHVNNVTNDIFFNLSGNLSKNGVYTKATKTCTTVACHSNGRGTYQSAQWGVTDNCNYCHPIASLGGAHAKHVDLSQTVSFYTYTANRSTTSGYNFGCSNCHPISTTNSHPILPIMIDFRPAVGGVGMLRSKNSAAITASGPVGTANSGTTADSVTNSVVKCINVYCHSNGYALNTVYATTPNWYGGTFSGDKCANCHGNSPNSTIAGSAAHYSTNFMGQGVTDGHLVGIHYDTIFTGTNGLAPMGTSNVSGHGNATTATTISCNLCHYATVTDTNNDKNVVCASCHNGTQAALRSESAVSNKSNHVNGTADVSFNPIKIRSKAQMLNSAIITPYSTIWVRNGGYKNPGSYDESKVTLNTATMWDSATKTCSNVSCHNNQPVKWGSTNGTTTCQRCHPNM